MDLAAKLDALEAIQDIEKLVARYAWYHTAMQWGEQTDLLFADAPDTSFEPFGMKISGKAAIRAAVTAQLKQELDGIDAANAKLHPGKTLPRGAGVRYVHLFTTPLIEVAADGRTARGVWLSPGYITQPRETGIVAAWSWHRYAIDFIKENGVWKIWHHHIFSEFTTALDKSWVESAMAPATGPSGPPPGASAAADTDYKIDKAPAAVPILPRPYHSYDANFSYVDRR